MNILSLFDGISCGRVALERAEITVGKYYAAEIDKYATKISESNYSDIIRLGDVTKWREWDIDWSSIDIIFGGFPCQAWSMAGKQLGDKDERGMLFWTMLDIMKHVRHYNPKADFLIENVKMKKEFEEYISYHMNNAVGDVYKTLINSALVSAQNRNRYYWTSWEVSQPEDKGFILADIIETNPENPTIMSDRFCERNSHILRDDISGKAKNLSAMEYVKNGRQGDYIKYGALRGRYIVDGKRADTSVESMVGLTEQRLELRKDDKINTLTTVQKDNLVVFGACSGRNPRIVKESVTGKSNTLTASYYKGLDADSRPGILLRKDVGLNYHDAISESYRKLTPIECERLQTLPDNYTNHVSNTQRYKAIGNGWTVDVIAHILSEMN